MLVLAIHHPSNLRWGAVGDDKKNCYGPEIFMKFSARYKIRANVQDPCTYYKID